MSKEFKNKLNELKQASTTAPAVTVLSSSAPPKRGRGRPKKVQIAPAPAQKEPQNTQEAQNAMRDQALNDPELKQKTIKAIAEVVKGVFDFWAGLDGIEEIRLHQVQAETLAERVYEVILIEKPDFKLDPRMMAWGALLLITYSVLKPRFDAVKKEREKRKAKEIKEQSPPQARTPLSGDQPVVTPPAGVKPVSLEDERNTIA